MLVVPLVMVVVVVVMLLPLRLAVLPLRVVVLELVADVVPVLVAVPEVILVLVCSQPGQPQQTACEHMSSNVETSYGHSLLQRSSASLHHAAKSITLLPVVGVPPLLKLHNLRSFPNAARSSTNPVAENVRVSLVTSGSETPVDTPAAPLRCLLLDSNAEWE